MFVDAALTYNEAAQSTRRVRRGGRHRRAAGDDDHPGGAGKRRRGRRARGDAGGSVRVAAAATRRRAGRRAGAVRIAGFDLGNSPWNIRPTMVPGKMVVLTTTNGTQAFRRVQSAVRTAGNAAAEAGQGPPCLCGVSAQRGAVAAALVDEARAIRATACCSCAAAPTGGFPREDAYCAAVILLHV